MKALAEVLKECGLAKAQVVTQDLQLILEFQVHGTVSVQAPPDGKMSPEEYARAFLNELEAKGEETPNSSQLSDMREAGAISGDQKQAIEEQVQSDWEHDNYRSAV